MLKQAFITAILGTLFLFFISYNLEPALIKISEISNNHLGNFVKVQGMIESVRQTESLIIIKITDEENISINILAQSADFQENQAVEVMGKVTEYKGMLEIEASKIKIVDNSE